MHQISTLTLSDPKFIAAFIATLLAIVGNVPYLRDVIRHRVEPHAYTWFVWSIITCIVFFGQLAKGAGIGALPTAASEIFTILIFIFSLHNGFKHVRPIDKFFLVLALAGLIPWAITHDPTVSVIIAVAIDLIAFIPTLRKTWDKPNSETPLLFLTNVIRHALMLYSLEAYNVATVLHSVVMITTNIVMVYFITQKKVV